MNDMPQYRKDLNDIALVGADIGLYMDLWTLLRTAESREDMATTKIFNSLHDVATIIRAIQEKTS